MLDLIIENQIVIVISVTILISLSDFLEGFWAAKRDGFMGAFLAGLPGAIYCFFIAMIFVTL